MLRKLTATQFDGANCISAFVSGLCLNCLWIAGTCTPRF